MLKRQKISKVICEICFKADEFYLCARCFIKYLENSKNFKNSTNLDKVSLKSSIQEIFSKNYQSFILYNQKLLKISNIENYKKNIKQIQNKLNIKQTIINSIETDIEKKKQNLQKFKQHLENERKKLKFSLNQNLPECQSKLKELNSLIIEKKIQFAKNLMKKCFLSQIEIQEFFEIQEYVKPDLNEALHIRKSSARENNLKEFDKIQNVLSFSDSICICNLKDNKDYDIKYEKLIKFKQNILKSRTNIFRLNSFILNLITGIKFLSSLFDIFLPYEINSLESFKIYNPFNQKFYDLYLPYEYSEIKSNTNRNSISSLNYFDNFQISSNSNSDKNLNEILQGYIYLDINLKFLKNFLNLSEAKTKINYKKYKKSVSFQNLHSVFAPDLKEFLNLKSFIPFEDEFYFYHTNLNDEIVHNKNLSEMDFVMNFKNEIEECENEIILDIKNNIGQNDNSHDKNKKEVEGYIFIEEYF